MTRLFWSSGVLPKLTIKQARSADNGGRAFLTQMQRTPRPGIDSACQKCDHHSARNIVKARLAVVVGKTQLMGGTQLMGSIFLLRTGIVIVTGGRRSCEAR